MKLTVICVERESPRVELRAEELLPTSSPSSGRVIRVESDIADFDLASLTEVAEMYGLTKFVLVAKHPCGIGVDRSIDCAVKLHESAGERPGHPELCGVVLATCCSNKLSLDDFRESRAQEFCQLNQQDLVSGSSSDLVRAVEVMSKCSAWRSASQSLGNAISEDQFSWAEIFEDHLQTPRLSKLRRCFGAAAEVRFAPRECTLQDRCLLAMKAPFPRNLMAHHDDDPRFFAALEQGVQELLSAAGGPIDCRPKGLKSTKYDFDYSED